MNTKYLFTLKTILETGSFQKAANKLNYTQSTVTFQIQQLEQELSIKLFERIGRKMILTQAGADMLPHIEAILNAEEQIGNYGKDYAQMNGTLKVAMPDSLIINRMYPTLYAYCQKAPNVQLIVKSLDCYTIRDEIISGGVDVGLHCDIGGYPPSVITKKLSTFKARLIASPNADPKLLDFITPHQRKNINLISSDTNSVHHKRLMDYLQEKDIVVNNNMEMWSIEAAKRGVMCNLGVTYLPDFAVEKELKNGWVIHVKTELDDIPVSVVCTYHKNKWISAPMELFINMLEERSAGSNPERDLRIALP